MTKTIVWIGPTLLTKYGLMTDGRVIELPKIDADSYIAQKLAREESDATDINTIEETD